MIDDVVGTASSTSGPRSVFAAGLNRRTDAVVRSGVFATVNNS